MFALLLAHSFNGPPFTVGIEEELMILDPDGWDLAQAINTILDNLPPELEGRVHPELFQSVLEIATPPCPDLHSAAAELTRMRTRLEDVTEEHGLRIAAAGTHPFARWEDQQIVDRERYHNLVEQLRYVVRQEIVFGTHVHVAIEGPDRAIYVADGIRRYLPLLLALSANSPYWRGEPTGMMSTRTPVFRQFPRVGIPPHYGTWEIFSNRIELMMRAGAIEDYTFLWWDVRPHPNLGTVETRIFDQQTRVEHTISLAALTICLAHRYTQLYDAGEPLVEYPTELVDDNKVRAAIRGIDGNLIDFRRGEQVPAPEMIRELMEMLAPHADELGCRAELDGVADLRENGTGAHRQIAICEPNRDMPALVAEMVQKSRPNSG
jgi:carboxylate-amine ligase